ncbi:hypothetical protein H0E87_014518 [Populus deltoides]|uniref:Uncharacterized protein n=1 Tax=Populus deltoides TaxID=3696 RepID=A0A8T2YDL7_POPDE|nr:hypothetical protein H0E87_014518 [Populus deltoides]KAH8503254.1 hypothetical protein H0E87_014518 [Populus deltoides]
MEKFLKPYDKEYMRMAMLKHEETFKEQVCELHRLYRTQKIMMRNIESNRPSARCRELWSSKNGFSFSQTNHARDMQQKSIAKLDLERPAELYVVESNADTVLELIDESEIQLTLGPSSYNRRRKRETPLTSDSGPSLSSTSTGSSHLNRTSSLTNQKINTRREELSGPELGLFQVPDITLGYQNGSKNSIGVEEQVRQDRLKQPPWLCQVLRLNIA